ncbi:hypothetical protein Acr_00g0036120 [Actinidia rufa]|uniref:Uncharacterized protein n=1 Tax=Actinidia rufa TaxID=165716 RepID=A0A7J0DHK6_9ERIC|nr:hypothetical protein Acr_00g0036120 [Actinidia rufa]
MDHQNKPQVSYPPPSTAYPAATGEGPYVVPPPMGLSDERRRSSEFPK